MNSLLIAQYTCLSCQNKYYVDFDYNGRNKYYCPYCGKQSLNIGRYFAKNITFEKETFNEWDVNSTELYELVQYLAENYPEGWGEDIIFHVEDIIFNNMTVDNIETYEDKKLSDLIQSVIEKHKETSKN